MNTPQQGKMLTLEVLMLRYTQTDTGENNTLQQFVLRGKKDNTL